MDQTTIVPTGGAALPPTYKQMLEAMGQQLNSRKSDLMKRVLLIAWPFILLVVLGYVFNKANVSVPSLGVIVYVVLAVIYSTVVRFIFEIEKRIWIDSFFDQKNLSLDDSWRIAKKLFWPAAIYRLQISIYFYLVPIVIAFIVIGAFAGFFLVTGEHSTNDIALTYIMAFFLWILFVGIYSFYFRIKLRYSWFVFLDTFGVETSNQARFEMIKKLNAVSKTETFTKSLIVNFGTDSANTIANIAIGTMTSFAAARFGELGKTVGTAINAYTSEMTRQAADLGNIAGQYMLYRFARKEAYGKEQEVNENIYRI